MLADGGEFYFSDVYCDRRLPEAGPNANCSPSHKMACECVKCSAVHDVASTGTHSI